MEFDLTKELGATERPSAQRLTLYIPNKDRVGGLVEDHEKWTKEAQELLTEIGGGATGFPPVDGTWRKPDGSNLWEQRLIPAKSGVGQQVGSRRWKWGHTRHSNPNAARGP